MSDDNASAASNKREPPTDTEGKNAAKKPKAAPMDKEDYEALIETMRKEHDATKEEFENWKKYAKLWEEQHTKSAKLEIELAKRKIELAKLEIEAELQDAKFKMELAKPKIEAELKATRDLALRFLTIPSKHRVMNDRGQLVKLRLIQLRESDVTSFSSIMGELKHLEELTLYGPNNWACNWGSLPSEIGHLQNLQRLELSRLHSLPASIGKLQSLEVLTIHHATMSSLPEEIGNLASLKELTLCYFSQVDSLPTSIGKLKSLETLFLYRTSDYILLKPFSLLPEEIGDLTSLKHLTLRGSSMRSLPAWIGKLKSLETLDLDHTSELSSLPEEIGDLTSLKLLSVDGSSMRSLPASIRKLKSLETLILDNTSEWRSLQKEIFDLPSLEFLSMNASSIRSLPASIGNLKKLEYLGVSNTGVKSLPDSVRGLACLRAIRCTHEIRDVHWDVLSSLPFFGCVVNTSDCYALACNRARYRLKVWATNCDFLQAWPLLITRATCAFGSYEDYHKKDDNLYSVCKADAVFQFLAIGRESFLQLIVNRERQLESQAVA